MSGPGCPARFEYGHVREASELTNEKEKKKKYPGKIYFLRIGLFVIFTGFPDVCYYEIERTRI